MLNFMHSNKPIFWLQYGAPYFVISEPKKVQNKEHITK